MEGNDTTANAERNEDSSSLESFLAMPFFDINFGENIMVDNIKLDMENDKNQEACAKFLQNIEKMQSLFNLDPICRSYRDDFSKAYKVLYKESKYGYLTEILDSCQESVPCLYVNGSSYEFSSEVLEKGKALFHSFCVLRKTLKTFRIKGVFDSFKKEMEKELRIQLKVFDRLWVDYESKYIQELMVIEEKARMPVTIAIKVFKELEIENKKEKDKGNIITSQLTPLARKLRGQLIDQFKLMNSVANVEGKGRDDLGVEVLEEAEKVLMQVSKAESETLRSLAENIKQIFEDMKNLVKEYSVNIEIVDPQLKNNLDLVALLKKYESFWEKGKTFLQDEKKKKQLIYFSNVLEGIIINLLINRAF